MKRTTIFLPESLERQLHQFARQHGQPLAVVVRDALTRHLAAHREPFTMPDTFDSGVTHVSERFDELLFKDFDIHGGSRPRTDKTDLK